jgi:hypothetical protein
LEEERRRNSEINRESLGQVAFFRGVQEEEPFPILPTSRLVAELETWKADDDDERAAPTQTFISSIDIDIP